MNFTVIWIREAEDDLTRIWLQAVDRTVIAKAAHEIEAQLKIAPLQVGESRSGGQRVIFSSPLGASYVCSQDDRADYVIDVWSY